MEPESVDNDFQIEEEPISRPKERRHALLFLGAFFVVALIGVGSAIFGGKMATVAARASDVAVKATSSAIDFAKELVDDPATLDGGLIGTAYQLPKEGKALVANLAEMKLYLFVDGVNTQSFDILSRGRPGTAWETPPGVYEVKTKETKHYSSIGDVWMPYSMQFQGNFFIHGWPYYPNGVDVAEGFSGGCIRMSTEDASLIYEFAETETPVIVLGDDTGNLSETTGSYILSDEAPDFPKLRAESFVVADLETGEVFARKNDEEVRAIASTAKLMTALVDLDLIDQYREIEISKDAVKTEESYGNLRAGETLTIGDLLYPLILESSNDAAEMLAESVGRNYFLKSMNDKATSIGLTSTYFDDPAGLSPETVSTAADMFRLAQYLHKHKTFILKTSLIKEYVVGSHRWRNNSQLINDEDYAGGKHGYIPEAGKTLVATFSIRLSEFDDRNIGVVLLNSSDPRGDSQAVKKYLKRWVAWEPAVGSDSLVVEPVE